MKLKSTQHFGMHINVTEVTQKHSLKFLTPQYNCSCLKNVLLSFDKLTTTFCLSFLTWFTLWTLFEKGMSTWCYVGRLKNPLVAHISPTHHDGIHGIMGRNLFWISHDNNPMFSIIFWGSGKNFNGFSIVFQASTGKKDWEKIPGPGNLMLDIPLISIFW